MRSIGGVDFRRRHTVARLIGSLLGLSSGVSGRNRRGAPWQAIPYDATVPAANANDLQRSPVILKHVREPKRAPLKVRVPSRSGGEVVRVAAIVVGENDPAAHEPATNTLTLGLVQTAGVDARPALSGTVDTADPGRYALRRVR